jgi:hypothetical protein
VLFLSFLGGFFALFLTRFFSFFERAGGSFQGLFGLFSRCPKQIPV